MIKILKGFFQDDENFYIALVFGVMWAIFVGSFFVHKIEGWNALISIAILAVAIVVSVPYKLHHDGVRVTRKYRKEEVCSK